MLQNNVGRDLPSGLEEESTRTHLVLFDDFGGILPRMRRRR